MSINDKHKELFNKVFGPYKAPIKGSYHVITTITPYIATGEFEAVKDHSRKWYHFWKPKTINREIYKTGEPIKIDRLVELEEGEEIK